MVPPPAHAALPPISALIAGFDSAAGEKLSLFERAFKKRPPFRFPLERERERKMSQNNETSAQQEVSSLQSS